MPDEHTLTLRQADQARSDFAAIETDLQFVMGQLARLPTRRDLAKAALGIIICDGGTRHPVGRSVLAPMMRATVPGAEHYRELADILREAARACQFAGARKEILASRGTLREPGRSSRSPGAIDDGDARGMMRSCPEDLSSF